MDKEKNTMGRVKGLLMKWQEENDIDSDPDFPDEEIIQIADDWLLANISKRDDEHDCHLIAGEDGCDHPSHKGE